MARKAKSPVTVCGNSRNVTFGSLERQNRKWPLSATDPRRTAQSSERRESTLQQMRATSSERLASETAEEREARLHEG